MIADRNRISITLTIDDTIVDAEASVSLGLIVTELVINALKHAFTEESDGRIAINFHSRGKDWELSVRDDGVGMPTGQAAPKSGLGTCITQALTRNLQADLALSNAAPGTLVTIRHQEALQNANRPLAT
jgi:two-component sensor histidine kinase